MPTLTGKQAEERARKYLLDEGFIILAQNWRTRWCEIDIVAKKTLREKLRKRPVIHFVEVKYRRSPVYGKGVDYITKAKLKQMHFAAEMWVADHAWQGDYQMDVIALDDTGYDVEITYLPNVNL
jgi:uncharacterized protein (TIGR00252 family)